MRLTRTAIQALQLPPGKAFAIHFDDTIPGFGVKVNAGGSRQYVVQYRGADSRTRRHTIGKVDVVPLDRAREEARKMLAQARLGGDPHAERAAERERAAVTVGRVVERYLAGGRGPRGPYKPRSLQEVRRHLTSHWSTLSELPIHKVTRAHIATRLGEIATQNGPFAANRARASLSALFVWAIKEGVVDANPTTNTNRQADEVSRDHVLADEELAAVWHACRDDDHGRAVKLLILTGQRRDEIGSMTWEELNLDTGVLSLPPARTKNKRVHDVPLSPAALEIVRAVDKREGRSLLFGTRKGGFSGWSKAKSEMDARIAETGITVRPWRLHDLRRTAATRMAELGTLPHVIEAVLNHATGFRSGVGGTYNRASYATEKRLALDAWAERVGNLVTSR